MKIIVRPPDSEEQARKKICLEQLAQDRQRLLMRWPFIGSVIMRMELIAVRDDRLDTACTDGNSIFMDIDFYSTLHKEERLFVLAHEVWHSVLMHFARKGSRQRELFNQAADLEIHFVLQDEKMREPWVLPHDPAWAGLSAETIYDKLLEQSKPKKSDPSGQDTPFDRHVYTGDKINDPNCENVENNSTTAQIADTMVVDKDFSPAVTADTAERVRGRVVAAASQIEQMQGKLPDNISRLVKNLLAPSIAWQEVLKQFVTTCYGGQRRWLPPSRRHVWQSLYLPGMRDKALKAAIALDTSGSTEEYLPAFFGELISLMKSFGRYELTVIQCDAEIQKIDHFDSDHTIPPAGELTCSGGGGTSFVPVFDYLKNQPEKPDLLIYLTDGYGDAPAAPPPYPVLWVLVRDGIKPASWGQSIVLKN